VTNISDLWPQSAADLGMVRSKPLLWAAGQLESWMYRRSAAITGQTDGIVTHIAARYPRKRVHLFPNGVDLDRYDVPFDRDAKRAQFGWVPTDFVLGYTGTLGHAQALDQVLDAARLLGDRPQVRIVFFGDGPRRAHLEQRIRREGLTRVTSFGPHPPHVMPQIQASLDAGLVPLARGRVLEGARPSKLFEMLAAARPVIVCARGEAARLVETAERGPIGLSVPPEDAAALASAIRDLCDRRVDAEHMGLRGRAFVRAQFDRRRIADDMARLLMSVSRGAS
jgi:glycosyltransferase involved in cell wall biosynthesis